jgi:hypothetical protein
MSPVNRNHGNDDMKKLLTVFALLPLLISCQRPSGAGDPAAVGKWENGGRAKVLEWFRHNVYGVNPVGRPADMVFGEREISMAGGKLKIELSVSLPKGASAENPVPVFVFGDHSNDQSSLPFRKRTYAGIPVDAITARGYAYVTFNFNDICPNTARGKFLDEWKKGVYQIYGGAERTADSWGTIAAWAWGFSRVVDWIETRPELDSGRIAVVGHSRGGKTALWAAVTDTRFAMSCVNDSGCCGSKLNRMDLPKSEHFTDIVSSFPFWFCPDFIRCVNRDAELPWDQHQLLALVAPRLLCVASASDDVWAGPEGEFEACRLASPAWETNGLKGLVADGFPPPEKPLQDGSISYHLRTGGHGLKPYDWTCYLDFAARHGW